MKRIWPAASCSSLHKKEKKESCCDHRHYTYICSYVCVYNVFGLWENKSCSYFLSFFLELRCDQIHYVIHVYIMSLVWPGSQLSQLYDPGLAPLASTNAQRDYNTT